jgi:hypothetical protein
MYTASPCGTIDKQSVTFRGRCTLKSIYAKQYGIKVWVLCDAKTFYCCSFQVYLGSNENAPERKGGARVVKDLASFWENSGRNVTADNFLQTFPWQKVF